jgi:hypothetical protein
MNVRVQGTNPIRTQSSTKLGKSCRQQITHRRETPGRETLQPLRQAGFPESRRSAGDRHVKAPYCRWTGKDILSVDQEARPCPSCQDASSIELRDRKYFLQFYGGVYLWSTQECCQTDRELHCTDAHEGKVCPGESNSGMMRTPRTRA